MSQYECVVPEIEWNLRQQRQEQVEGSEEKHLKGSERNHLYHHQQHYNVLDNNNNNNTIRSSHVRPGLLQQNLHHHPIISNNNVHQIAELTWENGQLSMHGHCDTILAASTPPKPVWRSTDTLESMVHQASHNQYVINPQQMNRIGEAEKKHFVSSSSSGQKISNNAETSASQTESILMMKKRTRSESEQCGTNNSNLFTNNSSSYSKGDHRYHHPQGIDLSLCGSASATFCREEDTTMMTWASFESPRSLKSKKTVDLDDSASLGISENQDEDCKTKTKTDQTGRSHSSSRRSRVAANHNQSERRRRDRINQKMRALQRLVPNAYKTDKASMLDEVIEYLKQLQAQVHTMMNMNVPHFTMMPLGIAQAQQQQQQQQQLQLSLLSRMVGLGMGMGMLDPNSAACAAAAAATTTPTFVSPQFVVPPAVVPVAQENADAGNNAPSSAPMPDPFCAFLAQNMNNIDLYNKMAALYRQQQIGSPSTTHHHQLGRDQQ